MGSTKMTDTELDYIHVFLNSFGIFVQHYPVWVIDFSLLFIIVLMTLYVALRSTALLLLIGFVLYVKLTLLQFKHMRDAIHLSQGDIL